MGPDVIPDMFHDNNGPPPPPDDQEHAWFYQPHILNEHDERILTAAMADENDDQVDKDQMGM